jgi:hypothetical protein
MALSAPEMRCPTLDIETQATLDDARVREIDQLVRESWIELSAICIRVRDRQEWKYMDGEYHSFDAWLVEAAPCCRATAYKGMGVLSVLAKDLGPEQLTGIEIGNASLLAQVSAAVRKDPEVLAAAKSGRHSKKLRDVVKKKFPEQHIEDVTEKKFHFQESRWQIVYDAIMSCRDAYGAPAMSYEEALEAICSEFLLGRGKTL